ncbi:MAG: hypothetical protein AAGC44_03095 [Planctomycetota bacterium]
MRAVRFLIPCLLMASMLVLVGCSSKTSSRHIRNNYTPELYSQVESHEKHLNDGHYAVNHAWRTMRDDWQRILFRDKPTRLTPIPVP